MKRRGLQILGYLVIGGLALVLAGLLGVGPLQSLKQNDDSTTAAADDDNDNDNASSTTAPPALEGRSYSNGDCVEWDQDESGTRDVSVIPCTEPHLMQIVGKVDATKHFSDKYPSNGAWMNFFDKVCGPLVEKLMGAKIDPYGRFAAGAIYVFPESWERGDRDVWCGATARGESPLQWKNLTPFRGSIEGASQQVLSAPGTCFSSQNTPVACALPHEYEIVGHTALGDRPPPAEDDTDAWSQRAAACEVLAREFMNRPLAEGEQWGWVPVLPVSWDAGAREVQCTVGRYAGEQRVPTSGSLQG